MSEDNPDPSSAPKVIQHDNVRAEKFPGGATYRTLVGDDNDSSDVRIGIQTSPPGYATPHHSHPYVEILTVMEGEGVAWIEGGASDLALKAGMTVVLPADRPHGFRVTGEAPLVTYGIHLSPDRIVSIHDDSPQDSGYPV